MQFSQNYMVKTEFVQQNCLNCLQRQKLMTTERAIGKMYNNKVKISGINTSNLKVMSEKEKKSLLLKIKNNDNPTKAREKLIKGNLKLVLSVVQRFSTRGENMDDLFQVGCIGLIKAIDRFDTTQNVRFSTYAVPMIQGELRRYLRDYCSVKVSRSLKDIAYKAMKIKEAFINKNNREPTFDEITKQLKEPRKNILMALESVVDPVSLYEPIYSDSHDTIYVMDQIGNQSNEQSWLNEILIKKAISDLTEREKKILSLRFMAGKTQVEVAKEIGISQAQVSRLEKSALNSIKSQVN